jgi:hypothetical protein
MHQPDNVETTRNGLVFTEDPGSSQQFSATDTDPRKTPARIWQYIFANGRLRVVARVNQAADEGPTDVDAAGKGNFGAWEASGIVDVSRWYGPGMFLVTIQAHTLWIEKRAGPDNEAPFGTPDWTYKREGGQLVLLHVPGG